MILAITNITKSESMTFFLQEIKWKRMNEHHHLYEVWEQSLEIKQMISHLSKQGYLWHDTAVLFLEKVFLYSKLNSAVVNNKTSLQQNQLFRKCTYTQYKEWPVTSTATMQAHVMNPVIVTLLASQVFEWIKQTQTPNYSTPFHHY